MLMKKLTLALALGAGASAVLAQTEIQWWHAMTGANNDVIVRLADDFNSAQKASSDQPWMSSAREHCT